MVSFGIPELLLEVICLRASYVSQVLSRRLVSVPCRETASAARRRLAAMGWAAAGSGMARDGYCRETAHVGVAAPRLVHADWRGIHRPCRRERQGLCH